MHRYATPSLPRALNMRDKVQLLPIIRFFFPVLYQLASRPATQLLLLFSFP